MSTPVRDATFRGLVAGALSGFLAFLQVEFGLVSEDGAAALAPVVIFAAFVVGGLYDRFVRR